VQVDIKVTDFNRAGVPNVPVTLSGTLGLSGTVTTDTSGTAVGNLAAAPAPGTYTVIATALGVQANRQVQVIASGAGGIDPAVGPISSAQPFDRAEHDFPQSAGQHDQQGSLRAKFLNGSNVAIERVRVRFEIEAPPWAAASRSARARPSCTATPTAKPLPTTSRARVPARPTA
jgi:hypothetical protein